MRFLKHWSRTSRLFSGWLVIKVALSSLKYYDRKAENVKNKVWKFKSRVTHLNLEHSWAAASPLALRERSLANSTQRSSCTGLQRLRPCSAPASAVQHDCSAMLTTGGPLTSGCWPPNQFQHSQPPRRGSRNSPDDFSSPQNGANLHTLLWALITSVLWRDKTHLHFFRS